MSPGWKSAAFDDCIEPVHYTRKIPRREFLTEGAFPIVSQEAGLINGYWDVRDDVFCADRPVIVFGDHTQVLKYVDFDFVLGADGVKLLRPRPFLMPKYFYYALQATTLHSLGYARHYRLLRQLTIAYPPLAEQERIVSRLDSMSAAVERVDECLRSAVYKAQSFQRAFAVSKFRQSAQWMETTIDKVSTNLDARRVPVTKAARKKGRYPYYGASGVVDHVADYIFSGPSLLVSEDGANLLARTTPIAFSASGEYWVNNHAHVLQFLDMATQRCVEFYLETIPLDQFVTGTAQPKLTQKALNSIPIRLPKDAAGRKELVQDIESAVVDTRTLQRIYSRKREVVTALRKALLQQACLSSW